VNAKKWLELFKALVELFSTGANIQLSNVLHQYLTLSRKLGDTVVNLLLALYQCSLFLQNVHSKISKLRNFIVQIKQAYLNIFVQA
jgi:hypothetical protein